LLTSYGARIALREPFRQHFPEQDEANFDKVAVRFYSCGTKIWK
jgi:hypothetical protein